MGLRRLALAALVAATAAKPALAGDWLQNLIQPQPVAVTASDPVELGTGWYLRGDAGVGFDTMPAFSGGSSKPNLSTWSVDLGAGYQINSWFRTDFTLDMRKMQTSTSTSASPIVCPNGSTGGNGALQVLSAGSSGATITEMDGSKISYAASAPIGYVWDQILGTCNQTLTSQLHTMTTMLNGYIDLGTWRGITPYIGAGVGVARLASQASINYYDTNSGALYAPTAGQWTETNGTPLVWVNSFGQILKPQPTIPGTSTVVSLSTPPAWNKTIKATRYNFAWSLMSGFAYALSDHAKLDIGFRYINMGTYQPLAGLSSVGSGTYSAKEVKVGFRYAID